MADTTQNTAAAAGNPNGSPSGAEGSPATAATSSNANTAVNTLDAALDAEWDDDEGNGEAGSNGSTTQDGSGSEAGDSGGQGADAGNRNAGESGTPGENANEAAPDELPDEIDPDKPPKGLEGVPKPVWKRITKQSERIRELQQQVAAASPIQIVAGPQTPLAHVTDTAALDREMTLAQSIQDLLGGLTKEDFIDKGNGKFIAEIELEDNQVLRFTEQQVQAKLAHAKSVLNPKTLMERQEYLRKREAAKPAEDAEKALPGVLTKGTPANTEYIAMLQSVPELAHRLPNFEVVIAAALRGMKQLDEEKSGKAKWVRMELDKDGKVILPKATNAGIAQPAKTTPVPNGSRAPVQTTRSGSGKDARTVLANLGEADSATRLDAAMDAELD